MVAAAQRKSAHFFHRRRGRVYRIVQNIRAIVLLIVVDFFDRAETIEFALELRGRRPRAQTADPNSRRRRRLTVADFQLKFADEFARQFDLQMRKTDG